MSALHGTYFNGERLGGEPVTLERTETDVLRITTPSAAWEVPFVDVRSSDRLGSTARFLYLPGSAVVETQDNDTVDAWLASARRGRIVAAIHYLESHRLITGIGCAFLAFVIALAIYFVPPRLAAAVALRVPPAVDERAGAAALAALDGYFAPSVMTADDRQRVLAQLERVVGAEALPRYRVEFRAMPGAPNAFALPGGIIVVADEVLTLGATDDELAALLAHEVSHVQRRHGLQTVLRNSFALLIVSGVTGDLSVLTSFAAALPLTVLTNGYARDLERQADADALVTLRRLGVPTKSFSSLLQLLETAGEGRSPARRNVPAYLRTHPATDERQAMFGALSAGEAAAQSTWRRPNVEVASQRAAEKLAREAARAQRPGPPRPVQVWRPNQKRVLMEPAGGFPKADTKPVALKQDPPEYPQAARRDGREGEVVVEFIVDEAGEVHTPRIVRSSDPMFEAPALAAVADWKFKPGRLNGVAVPVRMQVPVAFALNQEPPPKPASAAPEH